MEKFLVNLESEQLLALRRLSEDSGVSMAACIRGAVWNLFSGQISMEAAAGQAASGQVLLLAIRKG